MIKSFSIESTFNGIEAFSVFFYKLFSKLAKIHICNVYTMIKIFGERVFLYV